VRARISGEISHNRSFLKIIFKARCQNKHEKQLSASSSLSVRPQEIQLFPPGRFSCNFYIWVSYENWSIYSDFCYNRTNNRWESPRPLKTQTPTAFETSGTIKPSETTSHPRLNPQLQHCGNLEYGTNNCTVHEDLYTFQHSVATSIRNWDSLYICEIQDEDE